MKPVYSHDAIFSGKATLLCTNPKGETHILQVTTKPTNAIAFIALNQEYIGVVSPRPNATAIPIRLSPKSTHFKESRQYRIAQFILDCTLGFRALPDGYTIRHNGRCFVCGRELTDPNSIATGIGPICATRN